MRNKRAFSSQTVQCACCVLVVFIVPTPDGTKFACYPVKINFPQNTKQEPAHIQI